MQCFLCFGLLSCPPNQLVCKEAEVELQALCEDEHTLLMFANESYLEG